MYPSFNLRVSLWLKSLFSLNPALEFARVLKDNDNCILTTLNFLGQYIDLDLDKWKNLEAVLIRIRSKVKNAKKSLDCLEGEWWFSNISIISDMEKLRISDPLESWLDENEEVITTSTYHRKILTDLSMQQQRHRLSIVLESIKELSITENTSEITIAALALQLLSNQTANQDIAKLCKSIVHDHYPGKFDNILKKELDVDKAVFFINFLEIGKRKYTTTPALTI